MKKKRAKKEWSPNPYIFAALRRIWRWTPQRKEALINALSEGGYTCAGCSNVYQREDIAIDHKEPVVSIEKGFQGWDVYINRLFCPASNLQVLCKVQCHARKTKEENKERREHKKAA